MFEDIIKEDKEFPRMQLALIYTIDTLNSLVDKGIVKEKIFEVSDEAKELIKDFEPTEDELKQCVLYLTSDEFADYIEGE